MCIFYEKMKKKKNEHHHLILHIQISLVGTKFQLKLTSLIFGPNLLKKDISSLKQKSRPWSLLTILNFSAQGSTDTIF